MAKAKKPVSKRAGKIVKKAVRSKAGKKKHASDAFKTNPYFQAGTIEAKTKIAGNNFYKLRSKHGRDKIFASPTAMLEAFEEYCKAKADNPWYKLEKLGKKMVEVPTVMPLTWEGFCIFCNVAPSYFINFQKNLSEDGPQPLKLTEKERQDFKHVLELIRGVIRDQKFNGAATGYFKEALIAYELGIRKDTEQPDVSSSSTTIIVKSDEDKKLLEEVRKKLKE